MKHTQLRRGVAAFGAVLLGLAAAGGAVTAASAEPPTYGNIDFSKTDASLTVHKYLYQGSGGATGDFSQAPDPNTFTDPVEGVVFTVYPLLQGGVAADLTDEDTWEELAVGPSDQACGAPNGYTKGAGMPMPATGVTGVSTLTLPVGAYLVCETSAPSEIVDMAQPFVVTLPMPYSEGWVYQVHAYPKNGAFDSPDKTIEQVQPGHTQIGEVLYFPVSFTIPEMTRDWTQFTVTDALDPRLEPVGNGIHQVKLAGVEQTLSNWATLAEDSSGITNNTIVLSLNAGGLQRLNATRNVHAGKTFEVTFKARVVSLGTGTGSGEIKNTATFSPNPNKIFATNEVTVNMGQVTLVKRTQTVDGQSGTLAGAAFELYEAEEPYRQECTAEILENSSPLVVGPNNLTRITSNSSGEIVVPALFVSDSENAPQNALKRCYILKEVVAPAGFVLPTGVAALTPITVETGASGVNLELNPAIENVQVSGPELPLTGSAGQIMLIASGVALLTLAALLLVASRRRNGSVE